MLTSVMEKHPEIDFYGQVFKADESWIKYLDSKGIPEFKGQRFDDRIESRERFDGLRDKPGEREERNVKRFVDDYLEIRKYEGNGKLIGIKFHGGTLYDEEIKETFLQKDYKVILLHRENLLAAAISWYRARTLNQWAEKKEGNVKKIEEPLDILQLEWFVRKTQDDLAIWKDLLSGHPHLHLTYEQLTGEDNPYHQIWDYLRVKDIGSPPPQTKKLIKSYDHIVNIAEVRDHFRGRGVGMV